MTKNIPKELQYLLDNGFALFPLKQNSKAPNGSNGCKDATNDAAKLCRMIKNGDTGEHEWHLYNWGVEAKRSGLVLLDIDVKAGAGGNIRNGADSIRALVAKYGPLPPTLRVDTPSGGQHIYFKRPEGMDVRNVNDAPHIGIGLEVKADNQYLVAPPSSIDGKSYSFFNDLAIDDCPKWLADLTLQTPKPKGDAKQTTTKVVNTAEHDGESWKTLCDDFNKANPIEDVLQRYGYYDGGNGFWGYPNERTPSVKIDGNRSQHFGAGDPMNGNGVGDSKKCCYPCHIELHLGFGGDFKAFAKTHGKERQNESYKHLEPWKGQTLPNDEKVAREQHKPSKRKLTPTYVNWDDVQGGTDWLWDQHIPLEGLSMVAGVGGLGKSTILIALAATITTGGNFPNGDKAEQGDVILFSAEDTAKVIKQRFEANAGDLKRLHVADSFTDGKSTDYFSIAKLQYLEQMLDDKPNTKLVIIDPIGSFLDGVRNVHADAEVRKVLMPLSKLAEKRKIAVVLNGHFNKDANASTSNKIGGATSWWNLPRSVFYVVADDDGNKYMTHEKSNVAEGLQSSYIFAIKSTGVDWIGETNKRASDIIRNDNKRPRTIKDDAADWLADKLADGPMEFDKLKQYAERQGYNERLLRRAANELHVVKNRSGFGGGSKWELPADDRAF